MQTKSMGNLMRYCLLWIVVAACARVSAAEPLPANQAPGARPVILLTGFEPFGEEREANASWEGVKGLDGHQWHEFTLVSKQLPVLWGSPLPHLEKWIAEYKPVAVFSFGQGGRTFTVESRAANRRVDKPDNDGLKPPQAEIVAQGPEEYAATADCDRIVQTLAAKGYPIEVSTRAGRYLCEECLYSLEHLKATKRAPESVLFCHVPELGRAINGKPADGATIERFVNDVLEAWYAAHQASKQPPGEQVAAQQVAVQQGSKQPEAKQPGTKPADKVLEYSEIRKFVDRYFDTWSKQDMQGYGDCFSPAATIQFIDADGRVTTRGKGEFLATQIAYQGNTKNPAEERPVKVDMAIEAKLARALVYWKLTAGPRTEFGYDHFTLAKENGRWKILNLVFYSADPPK